MAVDSTSVSRLQCDRDLHSRPTWQIHDFEDTWFADFISVVATYSAENEHSFKTKETECVSNETAILTPKIPAQKQDPIKRGFFDLPVEIREEIYAFYCKRLLHQQHVAREMGQIVPMESLETRFPFRKPAPHICHQFRDEFITVWARQSEFEVIITNKEYPCWVYFPRLLERRLFWFYLRNFLCRLGPLARRHVRLIRLRWIVHVPYDKVLDRRHRHVQTLTRFDGRDVCSLFERLDDVHPDLKVELELSLSGGAEERPRLRRVFTLQQQAREVVRAKSIPDWISIDGPILKKR